MRDYCQFTEIRVSQTSSYHMPCGIVYTPSEIFEDIKNILVKCVKTHFKGYEGCYWVTFITEDERFELEQSLSTLDKIVKRVVNTQLAQTEEDWLLEGHRFIFN